MPLLIANPHLENWWIWERMEKFHQIFPGGDMVDSS